MISVYPIPAFSDNYIWCLHNGSDAVVVDPGDAAPVKAFLAQNQLTLKAILITHHHADHIGGLRALVADSIEVFGPVSERIPHITKALTDGDEISLACINCTFKVMHVPAHTREHIAFFGDGMLFCGDTMFSAGCGRLFEGTAAQMHRVFQRYRELPPETQVYCTHEYTSANIEFAESLTPENSELLKYKRWVTTQRQQDKPTLPSNIALEIKINPYMRTSEDEMVDALHQQTGQKPTDDIEAFAAIRQLKDNF